MSGHTLDELPEWPEGTACVLATVAADGTPHAIPVSTARRAGRRRIVFALTPARGSYERIAGDARATLLVMAEGAAFSAQGRVRVVAAPLFPDSRVHGLELVVDTIADHDAPTFGMDAGVRWHWTDADAEQADGAVRAALAGLGA